MRTPLEGALGCVAVAYTIGSIPFGLLLTRLLAGIDVRRVGSGNIGATNVRRAAGTVAGILTLLLDAAKVSLPMLWVQERLELEWVVAAGMAAFFGHLFPIWLRFRGGKGVAPALGLLLVLTPWVALAALLAFVLVVSLTRVVSLGSLTAVGVGVVGGFLCHGTGSPISWTGLVVGAAIVLKHHGNVRRLLRGGEPKLR